MNRPRDWYDMTPEQQRDWNRQEQAREDAEYDAQRARDDAEAAARRASRQRQADLEEINLARATSNEFEERCNELEEELTEARLDRDSALNALKLLSARLEREIAAGLQWQIDHACCKCEGATLVNVGEVGTFLCGRHAALAVIKDAEVPSA